MTPDLQGLTDFEIKGQAFFVFPLHGRDDTGVGFVELLMAVLVVLADSRVGPLFFFDGFSVLIPTEIACSGRLADVYGLVRAWTLIAVDAFFGFWRRSGFVLPAQNVF